MERDRLLWVANPLPMDDSARERLSRLLEDNAALRTVHESRQRLVELWEQAKVSNERLVSQLKDWCNQAEASGIDALHDFSAHLRGYLPQAQVV